MLGCFRVMNRHESVGTFQVQTCDLVMFEAIYLL